ncbi:hypothetical protein [Ferdinandcohnia sp. SAFN-114]|uniref:hypothetical protein n=1 Tax=Ferdinandcohnia sp. SAFN-114 TaxID=3387275 RepID=UPI003F7F744B
MNTPIPVSWPVTLKGIHNAIYWAAKKLRYSIDRPGMNKRDLSEALDDKIMGDVATIAVLSYFHHIKVPAVAYDQIRTDNFQKPDPGWDIAIGKNAINWGKSTQNPLYPEGLKTISVKSSRLPQYDTLKTAIQKRDFKIFKYREDIGSDISTDIELQVYYPYFSTQLGTLKITSDDVDRLKASQNIDYNLCAIIERKLNIQNRWGKCELVAYDDRQSMISYSNGLRTRTWKSFGKEMWIAPLKMGKTMSTITKFI